MTPPSPLISSTELAARLGDSALIVFDASAYMPAEGKDGAEVFRQGRIPAARFFDVDLIADPDTALPHMVPSQGRFARLVGALGLDNDKDVVVYDQKGLFSAARAWWLLRLFGHGRVRVLDGGLPRRRGRHRVRSRNQRLAQQCRLHRRRGCRQPRGR